MIIDLIIFLVFLSSIWIGWSMRIYVDWLRILWLVLFAVLVYFVLPYFISFVDHSSANLPLPLYYVFGIGVTVLIFLGFYMLIGQNHKTSSGVQRLAGSMVLALVSVYSLIVVLSAMSDYGWIDISQSLLFSKIPDWFLKPLK